MAKTRRRQDPTTAECGHGSRKGAGTISLLAEALNSHHASSVITTPERDAPRPLGAVGITADDHRAFLRTWHKDNVFGTRRPAREAGAIVLGRAILPKPTLLRTAMYRQYLAPRGIQEIVRLDILSDGWHSQSIALARPWASGPFTSDELAFARALMPHLQRVATLHAHIEGTTAIARTAIDAVEGAQAPLLLLDANGRVIHPNAEADHLLREAELRTAMQQAKIDLTSPKPVLEQVDVKSWFGCVDTALIHKAVAARSFDDAGGAAVSAERRTGTAGAQTSLTLRLHKVHCVDQTTPGVEEWASHDEILLGGTASSGSGDQTSTTEIQQFLVGKFKDGDEKVYDPPKVLKTFALSGTYPKTFLILMAMAEEDRGGFSTFLSDLLHSVTDEIDAVITAAGVAAGAALGGAIGGPAGMLVGAVGVVLVNEIIKLIGKIKNDEVFAAQQTAVQVASTSQKFANGTDTMDTRHWNFKDHAGEYNVFYSWAYT